MSFNTTDLVLYTATKNTSDLSNGGVMSSNIAVSGVQDNIFPDVSDNEKLNGSTTWRKVFWKNNNSSNLALRNPIVALTQYTSGNDIIVFCEGNNTDTQLDIQNTTRFYGSAQLRISVSAGATILQGTLENVNIVTFVTGDNIRIGNATQSEYFNNVTVSINNLNIAITLHAGDSIQGTYTSSTTVISSILPVNDLITTYDGLTTTSSSGILNISEYDIDTVNLGTAYQIWTLSFYNSTHFTLHGDSLGYVGDGNITENFIPLNTLTNAPYFVLYYGIWQGTWNTNDTVTFVTYPSAIALWFKRIITAGDTNTYTNFKHILRGQAASS